MDMPQNPRPGEPVGAGVLPDPDRTEKVRDLLHYLANTVSAMKIFPSEHATVANFVDQLTAKFTDFLAVHQKLQVGIEEFSFTFEGKPAYTDEVAIKSLPFFFFKDGLHILFFYQGLDRPEVFDFLELIKTEAQKPAEDSDIVAALWERDFSNIQYYAPDEFLENRILAERRDSSAPDLRPARGPGPRDDRGPGRYLEVHRGPDRSRRGGPRAGPQGLRPGGRQRGRGRRPRRGQARADGPGRSGRPG